MYPVSGPIPGERGRSPLIGRARVMRSPLTCRWGLLPKLEDQKQTSVSRERGPGHTDAETCLQRERGSALETTGTPASPLGPGVSIVSAAQMALLSPRV